MNDMDEIKKNEEYTAEITGYNSSGHGVCRINGRAVFVPYALRGEKWKIHIVKVTAGEVYARGIEMLSSSSGRTEPRCPYFKKCGGCGTWHMTYEEELSFKLGRVNDALQRIGKQNFQIHEILGSEKTERYRNKGIFNIGADAEGKACCGFFKERSHDIIQTEKCLIQAETAEKTAAAVCRFLNENGIRPFDENTGKGTVRHVFCREAVHTQDHVACIISAKGFGALTEKLVAALREACPELTGIVLNINKERYNTILSGDFYTLWGRECMTDVLCGHRFEISPQAFYQINPPQAEQLYRRAVEYAAMGKTDLAFELYCGAGTISLCLAEEFRNVTASEIVPEAIANAKSNAKANGIGNVEFICADAAQSAAVFAERQTKPDVILVDPPRKGMDEAAVEQIAGIAPERIVYVSCNPSTLARDILRLKKFGYEPAAGTAVDMFPRTPHVETVVLLSQQRPNDKIRVELDLTEFDITAAEKEATYQEIKDYILEKHGVKVSSLYISQIKRKCGLDVGDSYNKPKSEDAHVPQCPPEKENAIMDALKHYGII